MKFTHKKIIMGVDMDAAVATTLYHLLNPKAEIVGIYTTKILEAKETLDITNEKQMEDFIGIDFNINAFESVDHHLLNYDLIDYDYPTINPNLTHQIKAIYQKCPLNTAMVLIAKNQELRELAKKWVRNKENAKIALLFYGDSIHTIMKRYKENFLWWVKEYEIEFLSDYVYENYQKIREEITSINTILIANFDMKPLKDSKKYNTHQTPKTYADLEKMLNFVRYCFGLTPNIKIGWEEYEIQLKTVAEVRPLDSAFEELTSLHSQKRLLSHAIINYNLVSYTKIL